MQQVFLSPIKDQLTGFNKVTALEVLQHLFWFYEAIDKIDLKGKYVKLMGSYGPAEPISHLIDQIKKGRKFERVGGQMISDAMMVSKGITLLAQTETFNDNIR